MPSLFRRLRSFQFQARHLITVMIALLRLDCMATEKNKAGTLFGRRGVINAHKRLQGWEDEFEDYSRLP
eukprot:scaffold695_cov196-Alexandrium_tamarense.AAC.18